MKRYLRASLLSGETLIVSVQASKIQCDPCVLALERFERRKPVSVVFFPAPEPQSQSSNGEQTE